MDLQQSAAGETATDCFINNFSFGCITIKTADISGRLNPIGTNTVTYNYLNFKILEINHQRASSEKHRQAALGVNLIVSLLAETC